MVSTRNELGNLHYSVIARVLSVRGFDFLRTQKFLTNSLHFLVKLSLKILHFLDKIYKIIIQIMKNIPDYLKTVKECAEEWGISKRRMQIYYAEGRIKRAFKCGQSWLIPREAQKPPEKQRRK